MAGLTGRFDADFAPFTAAVAAAQNSLKGFEADGAKVETRLNNVGNALSGVRIIQQATLAAEAVTRLGGAGGTTAGILKLTDAELTKLGATAIEAQAKFAALGQTAPAAVNQIAAAAKNLTDQQKESSSQLADFATGLVAQWVSVQGAVELAMKAFDFAKDALAGAAALEDLSRATGIAADGLQRMSYVSAEFGVDQQTMARGVETFSTKLAEGDTKATRAVTDLGLSVKDLRAAGPQEAFLEIAEALGRIEDPMLKDGEAANVFGAKLSKNLLPMLGQLRDKMNEVPKDAIISDATIKSAHDFEVAIEHLEIRAKAFVADALGPLATGLMFITGQMDLWTAGINANSKGYDASAAATKKAAEGIASLSAGWGHLAAGAKDGEDATKKGTTATDVLNNHIKELRTQGIEPLSASQKAYLDIAEKANESAEISVTYIGGSVAAIKKYEDGLKAASEAAKKHQEAIDALNAAQVGLTSEEKGHVDYLQSLGLSEEKIANLMGKNVVQIHAYIAAVKEGDAITKLWKETFAEWRAQAGKAVEDTVRKIDEANAKEADARAHADTATMAEMTDFQNRVDAMHLHGTDLAIFNINKQRDAAQAALERNADKTTWYYQHASAEIREFYDHQIDLANHTYDTIEERMRAQGVLTKTEADIQLGYLQTDYDQMVQDGDYTASQLEAQWKKLNLARIADDDGWAAHAVALYSSISTSLNQSAQVATATGHATAAAALTGFSGISKGLADATKAQNEFGGSAGIASALFSSHASGTEKAAAGIASGLAVVNGAMSVWDATSHAGGKAASSFAGAMAGAQAGSAFGPWGAAIGGVAGALTGLIRGFTAGRRAVEDFATAQGGFDALHAKLDALPTGQGETLWKELTQGTAKGDPKAAQAEIDKITAALAAADKATAKFDTDAGNVFQQIQSFGGNIDASMLPYLNDLAKAGKLSADNVALLGKMSGDGKPTYQQLDALAKKYNLTLDQMGAGFQGAKIHDEFQSLIDDMDELQRGGVDLGAVLTQTGADGKLALSDLGTQVQNVIDQSMKYGQEVPENMKPAAQALIDQGLLLDANGNKITDINQIKFGESMQTSLETLNKTLKDLIDSLHVLSGTTATPTIAPKYVPPDMPPGTPAPTPPTPAANGGAQAEGGDYYVTKPTMFLAGEAGPESVSFGGANNKRLGGGTSATIAGPIHIHVMMPDGRTLAEVVVPHIPVVVKEYGLA